MKEIFDIDLMYDKRWRKKPKYGMLIVYLILFIISIIICGHDWSGKEEPIKTNLSRLV